MRSLATPWTLVGHTLPVVVQAFAFISSFSALSRCLIAPPGLPSDRLDALRNAATAAMADPELAKALRDRNLPFSPLGWKVQQEIMDRTVETSRGGGIRDARLGGLVQSPPTTRTDWLRAAGRVRSPLL